MSPEEIDSLLRPMDAIICLAVAVFCLGGVVVAIFELRQLNKRIKQREEEAKK